MWSGTPAPAGSRCCCAGPTTRWCWRSATTGAARPATGRRRRPRPDRHARTGGRLRRHAARPAPRRMAPGSGCTATLPVVDVGGTRAAAWLTRSACSSPTTRSWSAAGSRSSSTPSPTSRWSARPPTAPQAIEAAARLRPDVVLMDVRMPHVDGIAGHRPDLRRLRHPGARADHLRPRRVRLRRAAGRRERLPAQGHAPRRPGQRRAGGGRRRGAAGADRDPAADRRRGARAPPAAAPDTTTG